MRTILSNGNTTSPRSFKSLSVDNDRCMRIVHRYTTCSSSKHKDSETETLTRLRHATDQLAFAIEGSDWVEASADAAFLERHATERPPRAQFSVIAGRNACTHVEQALLDVHHLLAAITTVENVNSTKAQQLLQEQQNARTLVLEQVAVAKQLVSKGYQCVKQLRSDVATAEQRLARLKKES